MLKQARQFAWRKLPPGRTNPSAIPSRTSMYKQATRHINAKHRLFYPNVVGQHHSLNCNNTGRIDRIRTRLANERLHSVEPIKRNPRNPTRFVIYAEHQHPPAAIGEGRQLIGQVVLLWATDFCASEANLLEFKEIIFAKPYFFQQFAVRGKHLAFPRQNQFARAMSLNTLQKPCSNSHRFPAAFFAPVGVASDAKDAATLLTAPRHRQEYRSNDLRRTRSLTAGSRPRHRRAQPNAFLQTHPIHRTFCGD